MLSPFCIFPRQRHSRSSSLYKKDNGSGGSCKCYFKSWLCKLFFCLHTLSRIPLACISSWVYQRSPEETWIKFMDSRCLSLSLHGAAVDEAWQILASDSNSLSCLCLWHWVGHSAILIRVLISLRVSHKRQYRKQLANKAEWPAEFAFLIILIFFKVLGVCLSLWPMSEPLKVMNRRTNYWAVFILLCFLAGPTPNSSSEGQIETQNK